MSRFDLVLTEVVVYLCQSNKPRMDNVSVRNQRVHILEVAREIYECYLVILGMLLDRAEVY